ncbi:TRAP-type C4-dicarboxylate transport system permease small subunit [Modicisalibacter xianhensis]|uniref:TRAP transporter small permease protein n=1 Tax=Modicisalibacter xianhensis TaxID=442341 RepID=A0A4R8FSH9_9GAMM|nr:TRAP transporter small permease [Halomonas xianhensis]TDX29374.1 TRAP-type C4-dicarboxylate transport system permease small subunit [Halomonas xianhensis]
MAHSSSPSLLPNRGATGAYIRVMDAVSGATAVLAAAALAAGVLAVCHMIFMRYALGQSTIWQTEFAVFSITGAMLLGAPYVLLTGGHVAVTVLPDALSGWPRKLMLLASSLVGLGFCVALAYGAWLYVLEAWHGGWTTGTVWNPPLWPALLPMAIGASLLSLQYVAEILRGEANHGSSH